MNQVEKFIEITNWFKEWRNEDTMELCVQKDFERIRTIEELVGEKLPQDIYDLYHRFDGEKGNGYGSFFGHSLIGLNEMKSSLEFSKTLVKPENPIVSNPVESNSIIELIIKKVVAELPLKKKLGFIKQKWYKVEFQTGPGSFGGPYFYLNENTNNKEREVIRLTGETQSEISNLTKKVHELELNDYNWDNIEVTTYGNGKYEANRTFYDFDNQLPLTSTPLDSIKKKYFHIKWIPLITDYSGNYIGIDLDPDKSGIKGQIIIFGRNEDDMFVLADSWSDFLNYNQNLISQGGEQFKTESHLHEIYKNLKSA